MPIIPATWEVEISRIVAEASPGKDMRPYLKNNEKAKSWVCNSSGRVPA
jgi:hypothetical protein